MSETQAKTVVEKIHASGRGCVLSLTGGGSLALPVLLTVPGASATVLEAVVPYAADALAEWLGGKFDQACSEPTARAMAMAGLARAQRLFADPLALRGIAATASLATNRPKHGPHRVHVAWQSAEATVSYSCSLAKGLRTRAQEEAIAAELIVHAVAEACGVPTGPARVPSADEPIARREKVAPPEWMQLLLGIRTSVAYRQHDTPRVVLSGAFHPLHDGHRRMAEIAATRCGTPTVMELSITNVDKPALDFLEIESRLAGLADFPLLLTRAPTFAEKAALLPGAVFVVGVDTLARIADEKYYSGSCEKRDSAIAQIARHGCRFLAFGRVADGRFQLPSDLNLPSQLREICDEVPEREFRLDVSSTEQRTRR